MSDAVSLSITDSSKVGEARRTATTIARRLGFDDEEAGKVGIVVTELANNLMKHARGGELVLQAVEQPSSAGIEVLSLDKGPGMDLGQCLRDGYSTAGSPGTGLGAIARLSATFDAFSTGSNGSALLARLWAKSRSIGAASRVEVGAIRLPMPTETICGDAFAHQEAGSRQQSMIADGLGHGPLAADAANAAVRIFHTKPGREPVEMLGDIHAALRSTRGAAVAIADIDFQAEQVRYAGVGNICGTVVHGADTRSMISHNGIVGHQIHKIQEFAYPFPHGATLVMHSDGLNSHWRLDQYPSLANRDVTLIAGVLYRDCRRERDDTTVLVARARDESS